jgi:phthalate 4,5-cis-dihydrodiol dehydrogenase
MTNPIRLGVAGLGRGFMLMLPTLSTHPLIQLVAAADPRPEARAKFAADYHAQTYDSVEALCADPTVEAVYIATPHQFHVDNVRSAARHRKHEMVENPMALNLADSQAMIDGAAEANIHLLVGHSHSYDAPILATRALIESGEFGPVRMITATNFTDFLYRPRRPEELDTTQGGGVVFSQGAHQIDIVRLLGGGLARSIRAATGRWDPRRPTEGAYHAFVDFEGGISATLTYNGTAHFDTDEFCDWVGELGQPRDPASYGAARAALRKIATPEEEAALKNTRAYGLAEMPAQKPAAHNHFGLLIASCERADLRPMPAGVMIYADDERRLHKLPMPDVPRAEVVDELYAAIRTDTPPLHSGAWGKATVEMCLALLQSAKDGSEVTLHHQVAATLMR